MNITASLASQAERDKAKENQACKENTVTISLNCICLYSTLCIGTCNKCTDLKIPLWENWAFYVHYSLKRYYSVCYSETQAFSRGFVLPKHLNFFLPLFFPFLDLFFFLKRSHWPLCSWLVLSYPLKISSSRQSPIPSKKFYCNVKVAHFQGKYF